MNDEHTKEEFQRCKRLNDATAKAAEAGFDALMSTIRDDETIPEDADKILASAAAVIALFQGIVTAARRPENTLARRLIIAKVGEALGEAMTRLYAVEAGHA